jgi:oxygen-dependent protoporphyrinogen oxidase
VSRTIVVGAGLAGLVRSWTLARRGEEVLVLEASAEPGGVVRSERRNGYLIERGPNTVRPSPELWRLVRDLGLEARALFADARLPRYVDFGGRLQKLPMSPAALLSTRLLSGAGKLRLLSEPFRRRGGRPDESVARFASRRLGPEVAERFVAPFVSGVWAGDAERLSAEHAFPALARWERTRGSLLRGALSERKTKPAGEPAPPRGLLSFPEGLSEIPRALARELGGRLRTGMAVRAIEKSAEGFRVLSGPESFEAGRVVIATPADEAARVARELSAEAAAALAAIPSPPLAVLHLSWPEDSSRLDLRGFGHLVAPGADRRILGAVWSSSLFPGRAPAGRALFTVFLGGSRDPQAAALPDTGLLSVARRDLEQQLGVRGEPELVAVTRWPRSIPQYEAGHGERLAAVERAERQHPGLAFVGNYRGGVSVADVVRNAMGG